MRIMYLTESLGWSGGAQQSLWMADALQRRGHEVVFACQPASDIRERAVQAGLTIEPIRMRQDYDLPAAMAVTRILRKHRTEILHAQHSTAHAIGLVAAFWARVPAFAVTRRVNFPLKRNVFSRLKYVSSRVNGYVAVAESVKDALVKGGVAPSRIQVIPSIVNARQGRPEEGIALRQELGLPLDSPVITTVANYADFKGQDYLVKAAAIVAQRVPDAQFLLVGRGTERLKPLVEQLGLERRVRLVGFRTDIPRVLAATSLFVLPSLQEAAGTAVREAMSVGLPCIATRVGGLPEVISDGETGLLIPPADQERLAQAIVTLLENPDRAQALGEQGKRWAATHFSLEAACQQMEAFYTQLFCSEP